MSVFLYAFNFARPVFCIIYIWNCGSCDHEKKQPARESSLIVCNLFTREGDTHKHITNTFENCMGTCLLKAFGKVTLVFTYLLIYLRFN